MSQQVLFSRTRRREGPDVILQNYSVSQIPQPMIRDFFLPDCVSNLQNKFSQTRMSFTDWILTHPSINTWPSSCESVALSTPDDFTGVVKHNTTGSTSSQVTRYRFISLNFLTSVSTHPWHRTAHSAVLINWPSTWLHHARSGHNPDSL